MSRLLGPQTLCFIAPRSLQTRLSSSIPSSPPLARPKYLLPNGLVMTGIVTSAGKMSQTTTVTVEHRKTHPKTLKVSAPVHLPPFLAETVRHDSPAREAAGTMRCRDGTRLTGLSRRSQEFKEHHKFLVHDPDESTVVGDRVKIRNCRPVSKRKRFELVEILQGARERVENMSEVEGAATGPGEGAEQAKL